jgi:hypothetical protein
VTLEGAGVIGSARMPLPVTSPDDIGGRFDRGRNLMPWRPQLDRPPRQLIHPFMGAMDVTQRLPKLGEDRLLLRS